MGRDLVPIARHNLDVSSFEALAKDISNRMQFNIEYGYYDSEKNCELLGIPFVEEFISLGIAYFNKERDTIYRLIDFSYQEKLCYEKYGDALFSMAIYNYSDEEVFHSQEEIEEKKWILSELSYDLQYTSNGNSLAEIGREVINLDFEYFSRWSFFYNIVIYENYEEHIADFNKFRRNMMRFCELFGGDKIYYIDDQNRLLKGIGQSDELLYSWNELEIILKERLSDFIISIPKMMTDKYYKRSFQTCKNYDLGFVDDFSDL
ncbi:MAG: hypothetical protein ACOVQC_09325 [Flavobacterium sp.]